MLAQKFPFEVDPTQNMNKTLYYTFISGGSHQSGQGNLQVGNSIPEYTLS